MSEELMIGESPVSGYSEAGPLYPSRLSQKLSHRLKDTRV